MCGNGLFDARDGAWAHEWCGWIGPWGGEDGEGSILGVGRLDVGIGLCGKACVEVIPADAASKQQQEQKDPSSGAFALDDGFADIIEVVFCAVWEMHHRRGADT